SSSPDHFIHYFINSTSLQIENYSVIHGFDGSTFQRHFINPNSGNSNFFTKGHKYRLLCYYTEPKPGLLSDAFKVERFWKSHKYLQHNMWLEKWLRRELQALMQEEDVEIIMHHILGVIESFSRSHHPKGTPHLPQQKQGEFKVLVTNAATPFLAARTNRFVVEVELFLASGLTVEAYDRAYRRCLGWETPEKTSHGNEETSSERQPIAPTLYFIDDDFDEVDGVENEDVYA
ncbi:Patronin, partial [Bienertia sinuspersici]